ncbi:MAG: sigma-70 family RNA polymerase sigma factor [Verrucomicrobiota bacterium]|nr:sigma-70 family RNA polymerase sigma factor [Verrucomicrobiota bacterium]
MARAATGDLVAFEALVERHQMLVIGTVARMLGHNGDAEDISQQVFVRVWRNAKRYKPSAKFTTWLLTITRNLVFNECRRRKRHPVIPLDLAEKGQPMPADRGATPDAALREQELQRAIDSAITALPEKQRMAVILRRYEEKSYEEIGEIIGLSVPAVKSVLFRARAQLREALLPYLDR